MAPFNTISPQNLMRRIATPDAPILLDVRIREDIAAHAQTLPTAQLVSHSNLPAPLPGRDYVVICHKGLKLSHGAAALLRAQGAKAEVLEGGFLGWQDAGLPLIPLAALPARPSRWVTRHRPKIDRIACPWLIRRFVDARAQVLFVPPGEVLAVADRFDATPFDAEGAALGHRGDACTFDAMIDDFGLSHPALDRLAQVVRAADTNTHDASPQAAGLLALSVGLSRMYRDDSAQLEAALPLYDALYRWARDGFDEGHDG